MGTAQSPGINMTALTSQLTAVSMRLGVEQTPYSMTRQGLVFTQFNPNNPYVQEPLGVLIQTREGIPQNPASLAEDQSAMQSIVDSAGAEAKLLADIVKGDNAQRMDAASKIQSSLAPPTPGVNVMSVEDAVSSYRSSFIASVRSGMLLGLLLGESHVDVADQFFQAAVNLLQMNRYSAAAMFAEVAFDRIGVIEGDASPLKAKRSAWYRTFAARAWHGSLTASDPHEVTRFKIDRGLHNGWSNENPLVMIELYRASEELNLRQGRYAEAVRDMLRAALLMLGRGRKVLGEDAWSRTSEFIGSAALSASKDAKLRGTAEILSELHRQTTGKSA